MSLSAVYCRGFDLPIGFLYPCGKIIVHLWIYMGRKEVIYMDADGMLLVPYIPVSHAGIVVVEDKALFL